MSKCLRNGALALSLSALIFAPVFPFSNAVVAQKKIAVKAAVKSAFDPISAAGENALLKNSVTWTWGGKPQQGWELMLPLINVSLGLDASTPAGSAEFARALAHWQEVNHLPANGRLEQETLMHIIYQWQAKLPRPPAPAASDLVAADSLYLYDPARPAQLRLVERQTYAAYQRMIAAALADNTLKLAKSPNGQLAATEKFLKIVSAYRPQDYQDKLLSKAGGSSGALAKVSHHLSGRALDLYVGGEPTSTRDENRNLQIHTPAYLWLLHHAGQFGFSPYFFEPWHWEYNPASAPH